MLKSEFAAHVAQRQAQLHAEVGSLVHTPSIVLEIGSGHGHFLVRYASQHPEKFCIGVDLLGERIVRARRKAERARLANCHFLRAEAREFLTALPANVTLAELWILFPDPWPKKRHHKHRFLQPATLEYLASRTLPGTRLYFRTDHTGYFEAVRLFLPTLRTWAIAADDAWPMEHETVFQARAPSFQSLVAIRTEYPATPAETAALPPPTPAGPK